MIEVREPFSTEIFTLFKAYEFQVSVSSVLHGNLQGTVFVDEPLKPRTAVIMNPEGLFIVGNPENEAFGGS